jgi:hypothetical protein
MASNQDIILELIRQVPGLTDSEIRQRTGINPHQQVNAICNRLADKGLTRRERGPHGHWVNLPVESSTPSAPGHSPILPSGNCGVGRQIGPPAVGSGRPFRKSATPELLSHLEPARTLIVLPCSGTKRLGGHRMDGPRLHQQLPPELGACLASAQRALAQRAPRDESRLMPAVERYRGSFYEAADGTLAQAVGAGAHVLIISGGYGLLLPTEPIAHYNTRFHLSDWPDNLLQDCLAAYAQRYKLTSAVAFLSRSTDYAKLVRRTHWNRGGVNPAYLASPDSQGSGGTQRTVPMRPEMLSLPFGNAGCTPAGAVQTGCR